MQRSSEDLPFPELAPAMCHDLRSPLMAIAGAFSLVEARLGPDLSPPQRRGIEAGVRAVDHLAVLLDDIQLLAQLQGGGRPGAMARIPMASLVAEIAAPMRERASMRGVTIALEPAGDAAVVDVDLASRAIDCALVRAVAVSPACATVKVSVFTRSERVHVRVWDAGEIASEAELESVFRPFQALPGGRSGVGLALSRAIARAHGADAWAERLLGGGTAVYLAFPSQAYAVSPGPHS